MISLTESEFEEFQNRILNAHATAGDRYSGSHEIREIFDEYRQEGTAIFRVGNIDSWLEMDTNSLMQLTILLTREKNVLQVGISAEYKYDECVHYWSGTEEMEDKIYEYIQPKMMSAKYKNKDSETVMRCLAREMFSPSLLKMLGDHLAIKTQSDV